jgi:hypothetical protein
MNFGSVPLVEHADRGVIYGATGDIGFRTVRRLFPGGGEDIDR